MCLADVLYFSNSASTVNIKHLFNMISENELTLFKNYCRNVEHCGVSMSKQCSKMAIAKASPANYQTPAHRSCM